MGPGPCPRRAHSLGTVATGQRCVEGCDGGSMVLCCPPPPYLLSAGWGELGIAERSLGRKEEAPVLGQTLPLTSWVILGKSPSSSGPQVSIAKDG